MALNDEVLSEPGLTVRWVCRQGDLSERLVSVGAPGEGRAQHIDSGAYGARDMERRVSEVLRPFLTRDAPP